MYTSPRNNGGGATMSKVLVIRIAGQVKNQAKHNETMKRLKLNKKFTARIIDSENKVMMGMVKSVWDNVAYGKISDEFNAKLNEARPAKEGIHFLHPPRGGFKKSSRLPTPKGILREHDDIEALAGRML